MMNDKQRLAYRRLIKLGFVPYLVGPKPIANAVRGLFGLAPYRILGGWLPPRQEAR